MIIDFHTHCYPPEIAARAVPTMEKMSGFTAHSDGTLDGLKDNMRAEGIDYSVVLPVATKPTQVEKMNTIAIEQNHMQGIFSFGCMHPDYENRTAELRRIKDAGLTGVKLHFDYIGRYVNSDESIQLLNDILDTDLAVIIHAGFDPVSPDIHYTSVDRIVDVLPKLTKGKVILAHYGGLFQPEEALEKLAGRDVYLDCCAAHFLSPLPVLSEILKKHDPEKILYGSDSPWFSQIDTLMYLMQMGLSSETIERICWKNAARILKKSEIELQNDSILALK